MYVYFLLAQYNANQKVMQVFQHLLQCPGRTGFLGHSSKILLILLMLLKSFLMRKGQFKSSVQFSSVAQSCPTFCDPINFSMPGLPVYHQLPEFTQTHVHRVSDAIQPSHPLSSPSLSAPQSLPASESFPMSQLFS